MRLNAKYRTTSFWLHVAPAYRHEVRIMTSQLRKWEHLRSCTHLCWMNWSSLYLSLYCVLFCRMGRTTSLWQRAVTPKDLHWPLTPGAPTASPKVGKSWKLSSTMTTRRPSGQHHSLPPQCHLWKLQYSTVQSVVSSAQAVAAEREVQSAAQREDVWGHPCGAQQRHGECDSAGNTQSQNTFPLRTTVWKGLPSSDVSI